MKLKSKLLYGWGAVLLASFLPGSLQAVTVTQTGSLLADDSVTQFTFTIPTPQTVLFSTTSYGGGLNLNGTMNSAGGFVPVISLFSSTGAIIGSDGGDGLAGGCRGGAKADPGTKLCDDAYLLANLAAGSYTVALSEFPNVAIGDLSSGFLFTGNPSITGDLCGVPGGKFLESDVAPCVQRTSSFALNINTVPEPSTLWLAFPLVAAKFAYQRRRRV